MSELEYRRSRAKFVANLDLIYRGATSVAILLRVVYSPFLLIENYGNFKWVKELSILFLGSAYALLTTWAGVQLRSATDVGQTSTRALEASRFWLIVTMPQKIMECLLLIISFLIIFAIPAHIQIVLENLSFSFYIGMIICARTCLDVWALFVTFRFRKELKSAKRGNNGSQLCEIEG